MHLPIPSTVSVSLVFQGNGVQQILLDHQDIVAAVWAQSLSLTDAFVKIHVFPRIAESEPVEWGMTVSRPGGLKSYAVTQRVPGGTVSFLSN